MYDNQADCGCERCAIAREQADFQRLLLAARHEAITARLAAVLTELESGGYGGAPEADLGLMALTGLMLEKLNEFEAIMAETSGSQDDPVGEAAAARHTALMDRVRDAAERVRRQREPASENGDASLWYAACFDCTTVLEAVRRFHQLRAELPQGDPMRDPWLTIMLDLAQEASGNRARLQDTAIPDLDDGLAVARAALLAEAHAALDELEETVATNRREFNQGLPMVIRPALAALPAVAERAAAAEIGPADVHIARFDEPDPTSPHARGGLAVVYYYRGAKVVQSMLETYPTGFPSGSARRHVERLIDQLLALGPDDEELSDILLPHAAALLDLVNAGLHDVSRAGFDTFIARLQEQDLRHGAMLDVVTAVAGTDHDVWEYRLDDSDFDTEFANRRQARAIITAARRQGLDSVKLAKLAMTMGHDAEDLGVTLPAINREALQTLLRVALEAGFRHDAIDRIHQFMDPHGYEDALYARVRAGKGVDDDWDEDL